MPTVNILDFGPALDATFHVERRACEQPCPPSRGCRRCRTEPLAARASCAITAIAVHPITDDIVAGVLGSCSLLLFRSDGAGADAAE
jgi:hypothetical protein